MKIIDVTESEVLAENTQMADSFFKRLKGLLGTDGIESGSAMVLKPCNSVHTIGMRYPIDVIFVDGNNKVLKLVSHLPALRFAFCSEASYVVELKAGVIDARSLRIGNELRII